MGGSWSAGGGHLGGYASPRAEQGPAADCQKRPLVPRARSWQQLRPAYTSANESLIVNFCSRRREGGSMLSRSTKKIVGVVMLALTMISTAVAAERAASIEYEIVGRPANLQPDFIPPPDGALKFLTIKAIDGSRVDAVISQPNSKTAANTTLVVTVPVPVVATTPTRTGFWRAYSRLRVMLCSVSTHANPARGSIQRIFSKFDVTLKRLSLLPVPWVTALSFCTGTARADKVIKESAGINR